MNEEINTAPAATGEVGESLPVDQQQTPAPADAQAQAQKPEDSEQQRERDEKGRYRSRIDELTRARHEAEREAAYWKGRANTGTPPAAEAAQQAAVKPTPDQFEDYGAYVEALTDWKADQKAREVYQTREAEREAQTRQQQQATTWAERQAAVRQALPDYDDVLASADVPVAGHVVDVLKDSEHGPRLAYQLAKAPEMLQRLNSLSPTAAAREIGRMEAALPATTAPAAKLSNTPPPANHGRSAAPSAQRDPASMSMDEYRAMRAKQGARWAS